MIVGSKKFRLCHLLILSLLLVGCSPATTEPSGQTSAGSDAQVSPLVHVSVLPTPPPAGAPSPLLPTDIPVPTEAAESPAPAPAPASTDQLVILHTNDNWGETEPCG